MISERSDINPIRNLLDGLDTQRGHGSRWPFQRLGGHLLVVLDGVQFRRSDSIHRKLCSTRHVGTAKTKQYFHSML